mgnify:CR=1 FL=1
MLLAAQGMQNKDIADALGVGRVQVGRWRDRYAQAGLPGIERDLPRGAPPVKVDAARLVELTTQTKPEAATHWSTRKMAAVLEVSPSTVMRHWQANGLKPHLVRGFKISRDPKFVEKLEDIVGLYMSPPEHALVLCCDEKSQVQALDRTQPGLPMKKGRAQTMTHDYKRHGTTTLFAALNTLDGTVIVTALPSIAGGFGIGTLDATSTNAALLEAFRKGLHELGYIEGKNLVIMHRYAGGNMNHLAEHAAELVRETWRNLEEFQLSAGLALEALFVFDFFLILTIEIVGIATLVWVRFRRFPPFLAAYEKQLAKQKYASARKYADPDADRKSTRLNSSHT